MAIGALVPVTAGVWGVLDGFSPVHGDPSDQQRYLSGLLLMIGMAFWSTIRGIERKTTVFRLLTLIVFGGGLCRLLGLALDDAWRWEAAGPLIMELLITPLLCLWQSRLAATCPVVAVPHRSIPHGLEAIIDGPEAVFAKLYYWRAAEPKPTYVRPRRR